MNPMTTRVGALGSALLDLVMPRECVVCRVPGLAVCRSCERRLVSQPVVQGPGISRGDLTGADTCVPVRCAGWLTGDLDTVIRAWKDHGQRAIAHPLCRLLSGVIAADLPRNLDGRPPALARPVLTAIPATDRARWNRGEDIVARLALLTARQLATNGVEAAHHQILRVTRTVADQRHLGAADRRENVRGAFAVRCAVQAPVVVIDDVVTTGATIHEGVAALTRAGMHVVAVVTLAHTVMNGVGKYGHNEPFLG